MINYDDDVVEVYNGDELVFCGRYDDYFDDARSDELYDNYSFDSSHGEYIGSEQAVGWRVVKRA